MDSKTPPAHQEGDEEQAVLDDGKEECELDSESSDISESIKGGINNATDSNERGSSSPNNLKQASVDESQDSETGSLSVTDDDCLIVATDSTAKGDHETISISSSKPEVSETDTDVIVDSPSLSENKEDGDDKESIPKVNSNSDSTDKSNIIDSLDTASNPSVPAKDASNDGPGSTKLLSDTASSPSSKKGKPAIRKSRAKTNISEMTPQMLEQLRLPFKHGWKREVVHRNVTDSGKRGQCDIYYFAPTGKKLRSMVEIDDWLGANRESPVQYKHFSFARMPLFEPPAEIVRDAGKPRNALSSQGNQNKTQKISAKIPMKRKPSGFKLSCVLPKALNTHESSPKLFKAIETKVTSPRVQNTIHGSVSTLGKRPLVKRTKITGHTFLKKRRMSPEWRPWNEKDPKPPPPAPRHVEVIHPKTANRGNATGDDLQSILGTPSKFISSIVNPAPPKEIPKMPQLSSATNPSFIQVSGNTVPSNVKVHIVTHKDSTSTNDIIAQLGLTGKNVRMVNIPHKGPQLNLPNKPFAPRIIYQPAGQRPFKPAELPASGIGFHTISPGQSSTSATSIGSPTSFMSPVSKVIPLPTLLSKSGPSSNIMAQTITIPPPPPLALRPEFDDKHSKITLLPSSHTNPLTLHLAPRSLSILPKPPPLQTPLIRANVPHIIESELILPSTTSSSTPSAVSDSSVLLQQLASQSQLQVPTLNSMTSQGVAFSSISSNIIPAPVTQSNSSSTFVDNLEKSNVPTLIQALNCPVKISQGIGQYYGSSNFLGDRSIATINPSSGLGFDTSVVNDKTQGKSPSEIVRSSLNEDVSLVNLDKDTGSSASSLNGDDEDFHLPVNFGAPQSSSKIDLISESDLSQQVNISIPFSELDIYCPLSSRSSDSRESFSGVLSSISVELKDSENVFLRLPLSQFKNVNTQRPVNLMLNNHHLELIPGFMSVKEEDVKLKTSVKELKEWVGKQSLKMKVSSSQKRKITLKRFGDKSDFLRSFMLLQENYNIMMSIFKHLSIHDLLRACRVCRIWRRMALQKCLWRKLNLQNVARIKWIPAINFFLNVDVRTLIMPDPLLSVTDGHEMWNTIVDALGRMTQLKDIRFGAVSQQMIDRILEKMPQLKSLGAECITDSEPDFLSHTVPNTTATEVAMIHAVDLVASGGFGVSAAANMSGVPEADLAHLTRRNQASLDRVERESVLLCCMRLCQMGFVIDHNVIENRFQEAINKRNTSVKMSPHTQLMICQKMLRENHHLFQTKLPYQPQDSMALKLKGYACSLRALYHELELKTSSSILAFVMKEYQVLNAAGNKMQRVTALSVITPANLHLPVMLIFPSAISYPGPHPGLIVITSKEGKITTNLVTHYLRAVFDHVAVRPLVIFFDGHEHLLSHELVSECVSKSVMLHCVPKELSNFVFPGNHGGILHTVSNQIGRDLLQERKFIDMICFYLREDWWSNWQCMTRAFQITGTFPLSSSATPDIYHSVDSDHANAPSDGFNEDLDAAVSDEIMGMSDNSNGEEDDKEVVIVEKENDKEVGVSEEKKDIEADKHQKAKEMEKNTQHNEIDSEIKEPVSTHKKEEKLANLKDNESTKQSSPDEIISHNKSLRIGQDNNLKVNTTQSSSQSVQSTEAGEMSNKNEERANLSDNDVVELDSSAEDLSSIESDADTQDSSSFKRLFIHIDEDEKENKLASKGPFKKKLKISDSILGQNVSSLESITKTIDAVIASSRSYGDVHYKEKTSPSSPAGKKRAKEIEAQFQPSLKIKLSSKGEKGMVSVLSNDVKEGLKNLVHSRKNKTDKGNTTENSGQNEDEGDTVDISEEEEEDGSDKMALEDDELKSNENEANDETTNDPPTANVEGSSMEESDADISQEQSHEASPCGDGQEMHLTASSKKKKKKKKKSKKKKSKAEKKDDELNVDVDEDTNASERSSKRKKKKKHKKKGPEDKIDEEKESEDKDNLNEASIESKDEEKTMIFMRRISLADHDYDAKFDSDSGHEIVEEEKSTIDETITVDANSSIKDNEEISGNEQDSEKLPPVNDEDGDAKSQTSDSSSDSDSSENSTNNSSSSSSSSSGGDDNSGSSSAGDGDSSDDDAAVDSDAQGGNSSKGEDEEESSEASESEGNKEQNSSSDEEENQSENGDKETQSDKEEEDNNSDNDDDDENESGDGASSGENESEAVMYSDDEEEDSGGDDDSKCQLCMSSNPPHSKDQIIDWVDCDRNCGRWFHVICIQRSQTKSNPKHFVCPSCRCKR